MTFQVGPTEYPIHMLHFVKPDLVLLVYWDGRYQCERFTVLDQKMFYRMVRLPPAYQPPEVPAKAE